MTFRKACAFVSLALVLAVSGFAQGPSASSQALTLLQNSLAALTGGKPISDVTLTGNVRRISGSLDESGTAILKAISGDAGRMDLSLSSGSRSELCNASTANLTGAWSGPDGVSHPVAFRNC